MSEHNDIEDRRERLGSAYQDDTNIKTVNHGYTKFIKTLRILLPLIAVGIIGILIFSSERQEPALPIEEIPTPTQAENSSSSMPVIEKNELVKPQFESQTKDGKTYKITADNAVQELSQPDLILLEKPKGTYESEPYPLLITANNGTYDQKTQFMTLNDNVHISQERTGDIKLKSLEANLANGEMFSPHPVEMTGDYGILTAESMKVTNEGMTITFTGPASLTLKEGFETWFD